VQLLKRKGKLQEAVRALEAAFRASAPSAVLQQELGDLYLQLGRASDASRVFLDLIRTGTQDFETLQGLAEASYKLGNMADARKYAELALRSDPGSWRTSFLLGNLFREQSAFDAAEQYYRKTLELNRTHAESMYYLGNMLKSYSLRPSGTGSACFQSYMTVRARLHKVVIGTAGDWSNYVVNSI